MSITNELVKLRKAQLEELKRQRRLEYCLPHLHGFKHFWWTRKFFESDNRFNFLVASNQSGKSIVAIRKCIHWCTDQKLWETLWPRKPLYGMYFLPSLRLATREVENKWVKEVLPRDEMKNDPYYGWELKYQANDVSHIEFKNGFNLYFMSYTQKASDLQASSPSFVFCDEEMPEILWGEVSARLLATKGHYHLVCTPTIGEELWRRVFEGNLMPESLKLRVTMYDTCEYEDGTPGLRTKKEIEDYKATCSTERDIQVRVYGKFAKLEGLVYPSFQRDKNVIEATPIPDDYFYYAGIDIGSGGNGHPAAITIVGVRRDYKYGRVVKFWVGNNAENTSNADVLRIYLDMAQGLNVLQAFYDWASADFGIISQSVGNVYKADKSHQTGQDLINTLLKHKMLDIDDGEHVHKLVDEFLTYKHGVKANKAKNDGLDSLRYAVSKIPWEMAHLSATTQVKMKKKEEKKELTRGPITESRLMLEEIDHELEFWNDLYD